MRWARAYRAGVAAGRGRLASYRRRHGLAKYRATGAELERSLWVALLAEAYAKLERPELGLAAVDEALAAVEKSGVRFHEAELLRLRGSSCSRPTPDLTIEPRSCFVAPSTSRVSVRRSRSSCEPW